jgi:hypothetical protein
MGRTCSDTKGLQIMFTHRHLVRCTVSMAVCAACFITASAQAGPLGAGGAIGGGLNGGVVPRHLDVAGQAGAHGSATLPRGDKARDAAGAAVSKAGEAKAQATDKAVEARAGAAATGQAAKDAALDKAADAKAATHGKTWVSGAAKTSAEMPAGDASAGGSAQASRERGVINTRASVQGSARP